jgi:predicted O-methyltransferase YrrM
MRIAGWLGRLASKRDPAADPLTRALRAIMLGRVPPEERAWIERIEARRTSLLPGDAPAGVPRPEQFVCLSLPRQWCLLLMRIIREASPSSCLELGTGLGISTAYQAAALQLNGVGELTSLDSSAPLARTAAEGLADMGLDTATTRVGIIQTILPDEIERSGSFDFVFIDAEHEAAPTLDYFHTLLPNLTGGAIVVLDDVNWSPMSPVLPAIRSYEYVSTCLQMDRIGVAIVRA